MANIVKIKAVELVEDFTIYPRPAVDSSNVTRIFYSLEAGDVPDPLIVDKKSKRIIDGFHRKRAWLRFGGNDVEIDVELRDYKSEQEMFLEALRLNSRHGKPLEGSARATAVTKALNLDIDADQLAQHFGIKKERVEMIIVKQIGRIANSNVRVPLKASVKRKVDLQGGVLSAEQAAVMPSLGGAGPVLHTKQLILMIEHELIDLDDGNLVTELVHLEQLLDELLSTKKEPSREQEEAVTTS